MSVYLKEEHVREAEKLVAAARRNGGLAPVDVERFWADHAKAAADPWADDCPQVPLGVMMSGECVFDELGIPEDYHRLAHDDDYRVTHAKAYNDKAERIVGRRVLRETRCDLAKRYPPRKQLHDVFEAVNEWRAGSYWLRQSARNEDELAALLDRVERRLENLAEFILPENWAAEKARLTAEGVNPPLFRGMRGPVTFAMSVYGSENLIFLILDNPALAGRFRDVLTRAILAYARVLDAEAGVTAADRPGWGWCDDNSCLLNPEMYEFFGYPILEAVFAAYSPNPGDRRYQHSDSDMAHLLPLLGRLGLTGTNFGPTVAVREIRRHLPDAVIYGQIAPFTFSRNEEVNLVAECLRDFEMAREARGLYLATAGSINNGSRLTGMRLIMAAIQQYGRY